MTMPVEGGQPVPPPVPVGGARPALARLPRPELLVGTAITLGLTWIVTLGLFLTTDDRPDSYLGERYLPQAALLALVVAPIALLVSRGEYDLSFIGTAPIGAYLYGEVSDSGVLVALLMCAALGLAIGALIGVVRFLMRPPSVLLTLAAGFLLQAISYKLQLGGEEPATIDVYVLSDHVLGGSGWKVVAAFVSMALAVGLVFLPGWGMADASERPGPGPTVIGGYALSAAAACLYGGLLAGTSSQDPIIIFQTAGDLWFPLLTAIAVAGVVVGSGVVGPVAGVVAALAVVLLTDIPTLRAWEDGFIDEQLLLGGTFLVCLLIAHGLRRLLVSEPFEPAAEALAPPPPPPPPPAE
jgi:hypothetical protein